MGLKTSYLWGNQMNATKNELVQNCKKRLLELKSDLLNRIKDNRQDYHQRDRGRDEVDQTVEVLAENHFIDTQNRLQKQLVEIELALARIESGSYGICEETQEIIEPGRLLAIPWTRLSIEGAEIKDSMNKRFAKF